MADYDLIAIGSGPAGQTAAIEASKAGKRAAIADRNFDLGGVCLHTGTIPSKTLREAVLYLSGFRQRSFYGKGYRLKANIQVEDLMFRVTEVIKRQYQVIQDKLYRQRIDTLDGHARFTADPHVLEVVSAHGSETVSAEKILIACGTRPARRADIPFDAPQVYDSDEFIQVTKGELPGTIIVVGGGVIGLEYASMCAALNMEVIVVEARDSVLPFVDQEIVDSLLYHLRHAGVTFRFNEKVTTVEAPEGGDVTCSLESGKTLRAEALLYAVGRQPNTDRLNLEAIGLPVVDRGKLNVNEQYQTAIPHIYAAGDVIGFPALASTSMEQGRVAACCMFGLPVDHQPHLLPYGIYTIPEISVIGKTEKELTEAKIPFETGIASFEEVAKAQIAGDQTGILKLIFHCETLEVLGVHILGDSASELVHIGQTIMMNRGRVDTLLDTVFNYPSLAEAYRIAATHGLDKSRCRTASPHA